MMQVIKGFTPREALEYPILLLMCCSLKEINRYNEYGICVKAERQEAESFPMITLNQFHANHLFTVHSHLFLYLQIHLSVFS